MLRISETQIDAWTRAFKTQFETETLAFLRARRPGWAKGLTDADIMAHLEQTTRFAHNHDIRNAASLQRLALMKIDQDFETDTDSYPSLLLRAKGWSEARRIANFDAARRSDAGLQRIRLKP